MKSELMRMFAKQLSHYKQIGQGIPQQYLLTLTNFNRMGVAITSYCGADPMKLWSAYCPHIPELAGTISGWTTGEFYNEGSEMIINFQQVRGVKYFPPPPNFTNAVITKGRPRFIEKVPQPLGNVKMPKMIKNLKFMRGPELIHNSFIHKQYGIVALGGGRLRFGHFEMIRLTIGRKMDTSRMFTVWRIDPPWQPVTKKGQGQRMGGGKGAIDHYVTPIKDGRVIIELAGNCEFDEVKGFLDIVADNLPFKAIALSHEMLEQRKMDEKQKELDNINPYTFEYLIKNNMGGCQRWIKRIDHFHFGKYV